MQISSLTHKNSLKNSLGLDSKNKFKNVAVQPISGDFYKERISCFLLFFQLSLICFYVTHRQRYAAVKGSTSCYCLQTLEWHQQVRSVECSFA